ncbi:hypothetical protein [Goodfellowiella coeruleoviolacea]|uniref:Uncharacterized protein n=1 Tax=Goodfellowiella coeruleoviolacea TaxID=334858 RepID=A0AAE3GH28_9PSEU|nr:hypothetical protein [Goodfellowiella coeruleoviolacea]MCP2168122.1 hypothetical protein [Goodfellowiella coeruleoviolacea]
MMVTLKGERVLRAVRELLSVAVLVGLGVLTGCSSGGGTPTPTAPTSTSTTAAATSTTTTTTGPLLSRFGARLERQQLVRCDTDPFGSVCVQSIRNLGGTARDLVTIAGAMGEQYAGVVAEAQKVKAAADEWTEHCVHTDAGSTERSACLPTMGTLRTGSEAMLDRIYEVEQP